MKKLLMTFIVLLIVAGNGLLLIVSTGAVISTNTFEDGNNFFLSAPAGSIHIPSKINPNSIIYVTLLTEDTTLVWISFENSVTGQTSQSTPEAINATAYNITIDTYILSIGTWDYNITLINNSVSNYLAGSFTVVAPITLTDSLIQNILVPLSVLPIITGALIFLAKHTIFRKKE